MVDRERVVSLMVSGGDVGWRCPRMRIGEKDGASGKNEIGLVGVEWLKGVSGEQNESGTIQ